MKEKIEKKFTNNREISISHSNMGGPFGQNIYWSVSKVVKAQGKI